MNIALHPVAVWFQALMIATVAMLLAQAPPAGPAAPTPAPADNRASAAPASGPADGNAGGGTSVGNETWKVKLDQTLAQMNDPIALLVLAVSVVSLSWGWKFYRVLVVVAGFCVGAVSGNLVAEATATQISQSGNYPILMSLVSGAAFGGLAIPYLRTGLFLIVGATGAYAMFLAAQSIAPQYSLVFSIGGFAVCGIIATLFFQMIIVIGTSLIGGVAAVCGAMYFVQKYSPTWYQWTLEHSALLPAVAVGIAVLGVAIQFQIAPADGPHTGKPQGESGGADGGGSAPKASGDGHRTKA